MPAKPGNSARDFSLGALVLAGALLFLLLLSGLSAVLLLPWWWGYGAVVLFLWNSNTGMGRFIAVILMPSILLRLCLPRQLRDAVNGLPPEVASD
ncbi:MAG: hypothetical protein V4631_03345 [Pseudomonadota bacterium]